MYNNKTKWKQQTFSNDGVENSANIVNYMSVLNSKVKNIQLMD